MNNNDLSASNFNYMRDMIDSLVFCLEVFIKEMLPRRSMNVINYVSYNCVELNLEYKQ